MFTRRSVTEGLVKVLAVGAAVVIVAMAWLLAVAPSLGAHESPVTSQQLLTAVSALNASGTTIGSSYMSQCRESAVYIQWSAGTTAGTIKVESAHDTAYTGTWAPLLTDTWTAASSEDIVQITGVHSALRTRVSSAGITGGTVSAWLVCN